MKKVTLRDLEAITGKHHKILKQVLDRVPFEHGPKGAHLYESTVALPVIYERVSSLEQARIRQAETAAELNQLRAELIAKTRIPIDLVTSTLDQTLQAMAAILKAAKGKVLTVELINNIFADFRAIPSKLNW
jgi:hypothetical protein